MAQDAEKTGLQVTIMMFSGRPDPSYTITEKTLFEKVKGSISAAKERARFDKKTIIPSILGYRGIRVENKAKIQGIPAAVAVYRGTIEVRNERKKFLIDESGAFESFLINQALKKGAIDEKTLNRIKGGR